MSQSPHDPTGLSYRGGPHPGSGPKPKKPKGSRDARAVLEKFFTKKKQEELLKALLEEGVEKKNPTILNNLALQAFGRPREAPESGEDNPVIALLGELRDAYKEATEPPVGVPEEEALGPIGKRLKKQDAQTPVPS